MNLTAITATLGKDRKDDIECLLEELPKVKDDEQRYTVYLVFDIKHKNIHFESGEPVQDDTAKRLLYFGNKIGNKSQYYLNRDVESLHYILTSVISDLYNMLCKYGMQDGQIASIIKAMEDSGLVILSKRKGAGSINYQKFLLPDNYMIKGLTSNTNKAKIILSKPNKAEKIVSPEEFIRIGIGEKNKKNRFVLVIPTVIQEDDQRIVLSECPEYIKLVRLDNNIEKQGRVSSLQSKKVCYICHKGKDDVKTEDYIKNFDRTGLNKLFETTTKNTSSYLDNFDYEKTYSICHDCYLDLFNGDRKIRSMFKGKIAGEDVFILPEGLLEDFNYDYLYKLKKEVDLALNNDDTNDWLQNLEALANIDEIFYYSLNFVVYRTDGTSFGVLQTIEDVPTIRFKKIMEFIGQNVKMMQPHIKRMSLASIYRLIPIYQDKNGNKYTGRVLSLYKALLCGEQVDMNELFSYACEGLDKGLNQLKKDEIKNYFNMGLTRYKEYKDYADDYFIKDLVMDYLVLFNVCRQLNILTNDKTYRDKERGDDNMKINTVSEKVNSSINAMEDFLNTQQYTDEAKALFYLGVLIRRVAIYQMLKEHKSKPILKKIQFQGMTDMEVYRLYNEVVEKLRQYGKLNIFTEAVMNRFHYYYGCINRPIDKPWKLDGHANVFYIMSGYAYMISSSIPDVTDEEQEVVKKEIEAED
ncbi:CRISPR-associated protein Csh1 [Caldanaerobius fijiensis DSM 17918]|uniref:CRISPR-associated protein Csh1 n=1 Tax=Caldanaerobius fijiensis DSM 17918 TaxID=1121256 RepID=A0A1M5BPQ6_9THEO|nr:TM1802 family CRISPR-associated protein [Caldanaerobius fijiensis]SHF44395.1 CRISPR-associated protein Csh1 [Caldanaerobius fijiensis DSM 17918]